MKDNNNMEKQIAGHKYKEKLKEPMLYNLQKGWKRGWKYLLYNRIEVKELFWYGKGQLGVTWTLKRENYFWQQREKNNLPTTGLMRQ